MKKITALLFCFGTFFTGQAQVLDTLVDVGGYRLHFNITKGKGVPILFESGNGDDSTVWKDLLKPLYDATGATLITYDRAGLGLSEIDTTKIGLLNEVKGLEIGLKKLGYPKDVFVVCHSFGSYYTTLYALKNSKKVKGAVFIDALMPCFFTKDRAIETKETIGDEDWALIKREAIGLYYVLQHLEEIYELTQNDSFPFKIPVTVIGADIPPSIVKKDEREEWKACLRTFGTKPNHNYIFAKKCGHKVWKDNPVLVINAIAKLYEEVTQH